jgi:hypothetical protein
MARIKRDGLILDGPDGRCILVRGTSLPEALDRARDWAAEDGYALTAADDVRLQWIRAVPCPPREHSHDGWICNLGPGVFYLPGRPGPGAFQGILADLAYQSGPAGHTGKPEREAAEAAPSGAGRP